MKMNQIKKRDHWGNQDRINVARQSVPPAEKGPDRQSEKICGGEGQKDETRD